MTQSIQDRQALDAINQFYQLRQTVPDAKKISDTYSITIPRAQELIEEFLTTNGKPIPKSTPMNVLMNVPTNEPRKTRKPRGVHKSKEGILSFLVDTGSLGFAVFIDLILNGIGFWIIGPDPIMKIGMVCVSVIVVLFSVRAWIKRNVTLWAMFALVASFMDSSFVLAATDVQNANTGSDAELTRLADNEKKAQEYLDSLRALQLERGEGYRTQVQDAISAVDAAHAARIAWSGNKTERVEMSSGKVFTAIPDAVASGRWDRWIALALCMLIFPGLQLTIVSATGVKWRDK